MPKPLHRRTLGCLLLAALAPGRAGAQDLPAVPRPAIQELLVRTTLLTFNDAVVTGNFAVLHARTSRAFQAQFTPERLRAQFGEFVDNKVVLWSAAISPLAITTAEVNAQGVLTLIGTVPTIGRTKAAFNLGFVFEGGDWEIMRIRVTIEAA